MKKVHILILTMKKLVLENRYPEPLTQCLVLVHQEGAMDSSKVQSPPGGMRGGERRQHFTIPELLYKTMISSILFSVFPLEIA